MNKPWAYRYGIMGVRSVSKVIDRLALIYESASKLVYTFCRLELS